MHIWVDADACPAVIKDILYRAAERAKIPLTLVANKLLRTPPSPYIRALQVRHGIDVADSHIVRELAPGDLVVTADIPLAADVIAKGGHALNPRGEFYSPENIQERLALRNYLDELRGTGERTGGPARRSTTRTASASRTSSTAFSRVARMSAMARSILPEEKIHPAVREKVASYRTDILKEVRDAVAANQIVVVGMRQNPFPKKARKLLDDAGLAYKYLEYGSYLGEWRRRLALKMWTGWRAVPLGVVKGGLGGRGGGRAA